MEFLNNAWEQDISGSGTVQARLNAAAFRLPFYFLFRRSALLVRSADDIAVGRSLNPRGA